MKNQKPKITVAIPTYGRDQVLVDTIADVLAQDFDGFELLVVDQTPKHEPETHQYLQNLKDPRFRYYLVGPPSLPAARNFAIAKAKADIILFIDDDVILKPKFIQHHYEAYRHNPELAAVAGRVVNKDNSLYVQKKSSKPLYHDRYGLGHGSFNCTTSQDATDFPGGNVSMRISAINKIGGFDTSYQKSAIREESDAAYRMTHKDGKIYYEAKAELIHLAAPSGGTRIPVHYFDSLTFYSNDLLFTFKTVSPLNLPVALAKRYRDALRGTSFAKKLRRSWLFAAGAARALYLRVIPKNIQQQLVT